MGPYLNKLGLTSKQRENAILVDTWLSSVCLDTVCLETHWFDGEFYFNLSARSALGPTNLSSPRAPENTFKLMQTLSFVLSRPPTQHPSVLSYSGELAGPWRNSGTAAATFASSIDFCSLFPESHLAHSKTEDPSTQTKLLPPELSTQNVAGEGQ